MSDLNPKTQSETAGRIPLDVWAVLLALSLAALVRLGWFPGIAW
jgi:hypothetical protein